MKQIKTMCATHLALIMWVCWSNRILIFFNSTFLTFVQQSNTWLSEKPNVLCVSPHTEQMHCVTTGCSGITM